MEIDDKKWNEFIKLYFIAILGGIASGYIVAGKIVYHLTTPYFIIYLIFIVFVGGIIGYIFYSGIGIKSKPDNITPPPPPPSSPV